MRKKGLFKPYHLFAIALVAFFAVIWFSLEKRHEIVEISAIEEFVSNSMPNTWIIAYRNDSQANDTEVRLTLYVRGKGFIVIRNPTLSSFTGGGSFEVEQINDCTVSPIISLPDSTVYFKFGRKIQTIPEFISSWDEIYSFLKEHTHASSNATTSGCLVS
jgi:hypothetical protein